MAEIAYVCAHCRKEIEFSFMSEELAKVVVSPNIKQWRHVDTAAVQCKCVARPLA